MHAGLIKAITALPLLIISCLFEMGYLLLARQLSDDNLLAEGGMIFLPFFFNVCVYIHIHIYI